MPLKCTPLKPCPYLLLPRWEFMEHRDVLYSSSSYLSCLWCVWRNCKNMALPGHFLCVIVKPWLCYDSRTDTLLQKILLCGPEEKAQQLHVLSKNVKNHINTNQVQSFLLLCAAYSIRQHSTPVSDLGRFFLWNAGGIGKLELSYPDDADKCFLLLLANK